MSTKVKDERITRFIEIMDQDYNWVFSEDDAEIIFEVVDRIEKEFSEV